MSLEDLSTELKAGGVGAERQVRCIVSLRRSCSHRAILQESILAYLGNYLTELTFIDYLVGSACQDVL